MFLKELALNILESTTIEYLVFDTVKANKRLFYFDFSKDVKIHLLNKSVDEIYEKLLTKSSAGIMIIKDLLEKSEIEISNISVVSFFLFHEEYHLIEFLTLQMAPDAFYEYMHMECYNSNLNFYCNQILKAADVDKERAIMEYENYYRSIHYEKRADKYGVMKLLESAEYPDKI